MRLFDNLSKEELLALLNAYDEYIQNANDLQKYREGWFPVCIEEFYCWEFQLEDWNKYD